MGGKISDKNTRYPLTISKVLKKDLQNEAKKQNRSLNNLIITVLEDYISDRMLLEKDKK